MGCEFNFKVLKAQSKKEALAEAETIIAQAAYEHGHGGYTGSFAEAQGVEFVDSDLANANEAEKWLDDYADKWGPAIVVLTKDGKFCMGANCSS